MTLISKTYALEITVDHSLAVNVDQPPSNTAQLESDPVVREMTTQRFSVNLQA